MSLIKLIKNLDSPTKTKLLGEETTKILRWTFSSNNNDVLEDKILNLAVAAQLGQKLVQNKKYRELLIDSIKKNNLKNLGYENYDLAKSQYQSIAKFIIDFEIEQEYSIQSPSDERKNIEVLTPTHNEVCNLLSFPHDYQKRIKDELAQIFSSRLNPIVLASMPTGAGKTVLAMEFISDVFRSFEAIQQKKISILWVVTSKELCEQSLKSFQKLWRQKGDHKVYTERFFGKFDLMSNLSDSKITFATFDLLTARITSFEVNQLLRNIDLMIIDEAHYSEANTYSEIITKYKELNNSHKILALTATPYRSDDNEFNSFKNNFNYFLTIKDENNNSVNSPIEYLVSKEYLAQINYVLLKNNEGNITKMEYFRTLHNSILEECQNLIAAGENTIIFAQSKSHAVALSIFLNSQNVQNGLIIGDTPDIVRKNLLAKFESKDLKVMVNHQILSTGIDVPGLNSIMILGEISSPSLALQILGRAMRGIKNGGNKKNSVYLTRENFQKLSEYKILESQVLNQ